MDGVLAIEFAFNTIRTRLSAFIHDLSNLWIVMDTHIVTEPPQNGGVCFPRSYRGILDEARMHKHTHIGIQYHI
jgi:hypothetical protein